MHKLEFLGWINGKKESTTKNLLMVIHLLESKSIFFWLDGGWYEFEKDNFGNAVLDGKIIPSRTAFHSGHEL